MKKEDLKSPCFTHSQSVKAFRIGGRDYNRVACGYEIGEWYGIEDDCSNCGVATGFLHLLPCDLEQCPRCHKQALSCSCDYEKRPNQLRQANVEPEPKGAKSDRPANIATPSPTDGNTADAMGQLRLKMMKAPTDLGLQPTQEYPRVCGVLMDWLIQTGVVTVVSLSTGDASIYTTGTFGVLGGIGHKTVRDAARNFVAIGERHYDDAIFTNDYPYPKAGRLRFYLVCYDGVRVIDGDLASAISGKGPYSDLYAGAQQVITELRMITQKQKGETS